MASATPSTESTLSVRPPHTTIILAVVMIPSMSFKRETRDANVGSTFNDVEAITDLHEYEQRTKGFGTRRSVANVSIESDKSSLFAMAKDGQMCTDQFGQPLLELDEQQEHRLRHKLDRHLLPILALIYLMCFLDRSNIGNAKIAGLEQNLGMKHYDFNFLLMSFYIAFAFSELPMLYVVKRYGPAKVLPLCAIAFGLMTTAFAFVRGFRSAVAVRILLGIAESAIIPGLAYYLSRFYRRKEIAIRIASYLACAPLAGAVGGIICGGILRLPSIGMLHQWQMIFFVEGLLTTFAGALAYVLLPRSIETAKWLSPEEIALGVVRIKSENISSFGVVDAIRKQLIKRGMLAVTPLFIGFCNCVIFLTAQSLGFMLPTIIVGLFPGSSTSEQQLLTTPPYLVALILELANAFIVTKTRQFTICLTTSMLFGIIGYTISVVTTVDQACARYVATFFTAVSAFSAVPVAMAFVLVNNNSDCERAAALSMFMLTAYAAATGSAFIYLPSEFPDYRNANLASAVMCAASVVSVVVCGFLLRRENRARERGERDHRLNGLSIEKHHLLGRHHPSFRYQY